MMSWHKTCKKCFAKDTFGVNSRNWKHLHIYTANLVNFELGSLHQIHNYQYQFVWNFFWYIFYFLVENTICRGLPNSWWYNKKYLGSTKAVDKSKSINTTEKCIPKKVHMQNFSYFLNYYIDYYLSKNSFRDTFTAFVFSERGYAPVAFHNSEILQRMHALEFGNSI